MSLFTALFARVRRRRGRDQIRDLAQDGRWREAFAIAFSGLVLEKSPISTLVETLPPETRDELLSTSFDEIEARIFDLWLVSHALRRSVKHIPRPDLLSVLDAGHLEVYRELIAAGMREDEIMTLQHRLAQRYAEYDVAYGRFWAGDDNLMFALSRLVTSRVFHQETTSARVVATLAHLVVTPKVMSIAKTFAEFKPPKGTSS